MVHVKIPQECKARLVGIDHSNTKIYIIGQGIATAEKEIL